MNETTTLLAPAILEKYKEYPPETVDIPAVEAAVIINSSPRTLEKWRQTRKNISFFRTPSGVTYNLEEILKYKESLKIKLIKKFD